MSTKNWLPQYGTRTSLVRTVPQEPTKHKARITVVSHTRLDLFHPNNPSSQFLTSIQSQRAPKNKNPHRCFLWFPWHRFQTTYTPYRLISFFLNNRSSIRSTEIMMFDKSTLLVFSFLLHSAFGDPCAFSLSMDCSETIPVDNPDEGKPWVLGNAGGVNNSGGYVWMIGCWLEHIDALTNLMLFFLLLLLFCFVFVNAVFEIL